MHRIGSCSPSSLLYCTVCEPFSIHFPWFGHLMNIPSLPWLVPCESLFFLPLLCFNYWFTYLSILSDQSLVSNWRWGLRHVYIAIFSVLILHYCACVWLLFWLCSYSFSPSWLGFRHCPLSSHTQWQIPIQHIAKRLVWHDGTQTVWFSARWYANRLVLGTMVHEPLRFGLIFLFLTSLALLGLSLPILHVVHGLW